MGASAKATPSIDIEITAGVPAAVAMLSEAGAVERATRAFVDRFDPNGDSFAAALHDLGLLIGGHTDSLAVSIDGLEADLVAVVDRTGRRVAVLAVAAAEDAEDREPVSPVLDEPLDESPAIVWLKDLDGRYLRVNKHYVEALQTDIEHVRGRTDAELTPAGSIEGPRLQEKDTAGLEPLELEYRIGEYEERPAFTALRFALRDAEGRPTAICSVAAPVAQGALATSECERLMAIDRWGRLDELSIRQELLDEWGLTLADGSSGPPLDRDERVAAVVAERDEALATAKRLEEELLAEREQRGSLRVESERARLRADELGGALAAEQARAAELEQAQAKAEAHAGELEAQLATIRSELAEQHGSEERVQVVLAERDEALATAARLEQELAVEREQGAGLSAESERARLRAQELDTAVAAERARAQELEQSRVDAEARAGELEAELTRIREQLQERTSAAQVELDEALATATRLEAELASERERGGSLSAESDGARARAQELDEAVAAERARAQELEQSRARAEAQAGELEAKLAEVRERLEERTAAALAERDEAQATAKRLQDELRSER